MRNSNGSGGLRIAKEFPTVSGFPLDPLLHLLDRMNKCQQRGRLWSRPHDQLHLYSKLRLRKGTKDNRSSLRKSRGGTRSERHTHALFCHGRGLLGIRPLSGVIPAALPHQALVHCASQLL